MTPSSRLKAALQGLAESMERLAEALARIETHRGQLHLHQNEAYQLHGSPFGPGRQAIAVWLAYRQYTTSN